MKSIGKLYIRMRYTYTVEECALVKWKSLITIDVRKIFPTIGQIQHIRLVEMYARPQRQYVQTQPVHVLLSRTIKTPSTVNAERVRTGIIVFINVE